MTTCSFSPKEAAKVTDTIIDKIGRTYQVNNNNFFFEFFYLRLT
jgi:hypothetical protein